MSWFMVFYLHKFTKVEDYQTNLSTRSIIPSHSPEEKQNNLKGVNASSYINRLIHLYFLSE